MTKSEIGERFETIPEPFLAVQWDGQKKTAKRIIKWVDSDNRRFEDENSVEYREQFREATNVPYISFNGAGGLHSMVYVGDWIVCDLNATSHRFMVYRDEEFKKRFRRSI